MRVCAVTTWPPHRDGIASYSWKLYNEVAKYIDVTVIANTSPNLTERKNVNQASLQVVKCWERGSFLLFPRVFKQVEKSRADVIHVQHGWLLYGRPIVSTFFPLLLLMLRFSFKPVITTFHSVIQRTAFTEESAEEKSLKTLSTWTVFFITKLTGRLSSKIIVHNALMKKYLETEYRLTPQKIIIIPHGTDKAQIIQATNSQEQIMFFGHLRSLKGIEDLLEAFRLLRKKNPKVSLTIAGSPHAHDKLDYVAKLQRLVAEPDISGKVKMENYVSEDRLSKLISTSEVIVLPYLDDGFIEASGAIARMMDYGKPIVYTNIPKFRGELGNGFRSVMVETGNPADLAEKLHSLLQDGHFREEMGKRLKKMAQSRYWNITAKKHVELYQSLLSRKKNS